MGGVGGHSSTWKIMKTTSSLPPIHCQTKSRPLASQLSWQWNWFQNPHESSAAPSWLPSERTGSTTKWSAGWLKQNSLLCWHLSSAAVHKARKVMVVGPHWPKTNMGESNWNYLVFLEKPRLVRLRRVELSHALVYEASCEELHSADCLQLS